MSNNHQNKQSQAVRILALVLAGLMVLSAAVIVISLIAAAL
ncbi:MAG: hypothetical protein ACI3XL_01095 [Eubacteriales bacterium]